MSKSESENNLAATKKVFTAIVVVAILLVIVLALLLIVTLTSGGFARGSSTAPDNVIADESGNAAGVKKTNNGVVITSDMVEYLSLSMWNSDTDYRFVAENLFPGDTETRVYEVTIKNAKIKAVAFGIELKSANTLLADVLEVYIYEASTEKVLYEGMMSGLSDPVFVAVPNGCEKLQYEITVSLATSVGNEYANLSLSADFYWSVDDTYIETTEPDTTEPGTTEPGTTEPGTTEPGTTEPGTTEPGTTEPGTTEPGTTEPGTTEPGTTEPGTTNDGNTCDSDGDGICDCIEGECNCDVNGDGTCDCGICNDECACGCHTHPCDVDGDGTCDCDPDADCDCDYDCPCEDCKCRCCPWCFGICPLCWMIPMMVAEATLEKIIALVAWQILRRREKSDE